MLAETDRAIEEIDSQRRELAEQLLGIRSLIGGALSEQFLRVPQKGKKEPALRGPYYVLSRSVKGHTKSKRVGKKDVEQVRQDVDSYRRFEALCKELAQFTERLGKAEREKMEAKDTEQLKKGLKSPSNRARK